MVVMVVAEAMRMTVVMVIMAVVVVRVCVVVAHASIPLAGSAMCSNMVESRLLMWASAAE